MAEKEYQRLTRARPRSRFAVISSVNSSLWLGKDHLLCIDSNGYTENYKRFYFRDIQAMVICKTRRWLYLALPLAFLAGLLLLFALINSDVTAKIVLACAGGAFLLILALHLAMGPSASTHLRTAVQTEQLPSLNGLRRARKVLARLIPLITAAQGELSPAELSSRLGTPDAPATPAATAPEPVAEADVPPRINP